MVTPTSKKEDSTREAYEQFVAIMDKKQHRKAFELFSKTPSLVNEMRLKEFSKYFRALLKRVGGEEASLFEIATRSAFEDAYRKVFWEMSSTLNK